MLSPIAYIDKLCVLWLCLSTTSKPPWVDADHHDPLGRTPARYLGETLMQFHTPNYPAKHLLSLSLRMAESAVGFLLPTMRAVL